MVHLRKPRDAPEEYLRLQTSQTRKEKPSMGTIESDGVAMYVHYRRLEADRSVLSSGSRSAKYEH
jgi:hypothetical protein